jgi:hypothetical protein
MISFFIRRRTALLCLFVSYFSIDAASYTPPIIRSLNADNVRYGQIGSIVGIDVNSNATVLAGTAPDFDRALLTVTITQGLLDEDSLLIRPITTGAARITLQGRRVLYNGLAIAVYQPTQSWRSLTIRFNARATAAGITAVVRSLAYTNLNIINPAVTTRTISVTISDGYGSVSTTSEVGLIIQPPRPLPVATPDYYRVAAGQTSLAIPAPGVLKNDYHPANDVYYAALTRDTPVGHVVIGRDGSVQYTPQPGSTGIYTATYTVCDTWGGCTAATITFQVGDDNQSPHAAPDYYHLYEHRGLFVGNRARGVLANDTDPNSGSTIVHTATLVTPPAHGTITFYPDGTFHYHPTPGYHGVDTFLYKTCDSENACAEGIATITIADVDYPPYAPDIILTVTDTTLVNGDLLQGVVNHDGDPLQSSILTEPVWGALFRTEGSGFSYVSRSNQEGVERLLYRVCDSGLQCDTAALVISIINTNNKPVVSLPPVLSVLEDTPTVFSEISFSDADAGANAVRVTFETIQSGSSWTARSGPAALAVVRNGTRIVTVTGPIASINSWLKQQGLVFTPTKDATSDQSIRITINDLGNTGSDGAQQTAILKSVVIVAVNDAPVNILPGNLTTKEGEVLTFEGERAIRISDLDAGTGNLRVTISAANGMIVLRPASSVASNTEVSTLTLTGRADSINVAVATLAFRPLKPGVATLSIISDDLGNTGEGGPQTATGEILIHVTAAPAVITRVVTHAADGLYKAGDRITLAVQFNRAIWVSQGTPTIALATGEGGQAVYQGGSGTTELLFDYTVRKGDSTPRLDYTDVRALSSNGASLQDSLAVSAIVTLPTPGSPASLRGTSNLSIDGIPPAPPQLVTPAAGSIIDDDVLTLTGVSEVGAHVLITLNGNRIGTTVADVMGHWNYQHDGMLYTGKHTLLLHATDSAGNMSDPSSVVTLFVTRGMVVSILPDEHRFIARIYPIPARDILVVDVTGSVQPPVTLDLVDGRGVICPEIHWQRDGHVFVANVSSLSGGLYVLLLTTAHERYTERILVVK